MVLSKCALHRVKSKLPLSEALVFFVVVCGIRENQSEEEK